MPLTNRSLADMIDDDTMESMAISAGQRGTDGNQIREMYGLERPDGPESLRAALRSEFTAPANHMLKSHFEDYNINPHVQRVLDQIGIDAVHLKAVAAWTNEAIDIEVDETLSLSIYANKMNDRLSVSFRMGADQRGIWEFDEDEHGENTTGCIEITDSPLPETVLLSLVGLPLDKVLSHRITDGFGLTIARAEHYPPNNSTWMMFEHCLRTSDPNGKPILQETTR